jgi:hypothetical protein
MPTLLVFHEVDDVDEWLKSPRREEIFEPMGVTARLFRDPKARIGWARSWRCLTWPPSRR